MTGDGGARDASITIRAAREEDYAAIVEVWRDSGLSVRVAGRDAPAAFAVQRAQFAETYLVAESDNRLIGVVFGTHDWRKGWINRLAVRPEYRRRGVAKALVSACEAALCGRGIGLVAALVEPDRPASASLLASLGYREDVPVRYFRKLNQPDA